MASSETRSNGDGFLGVSEFFKNLRVLSPLRVIQISGPSIFETICSVDSFSIKDGWLNAITPHYHWHLELNRFRHLTTRDTIHERSGRRVLLFELRESGDDEPFLLIYLHRDKGEEFDRARRDAFAALQERCSEGVHIEQTRQ